MTRSRQIAGLTTAALMILLVLFLTVYRLQWNPTQPWPPQPKPYIEFDEEEFIEPEEIPPASDSPEDAAAYSEQTQDVAAEAAPTGGTALDNRGATAPEAPQEVTANKPAPVAKNPVKPKEKTGAQADNEAAKKEAEAKATRNTVKNAFAKPNAKDNANNRNGSKGNAGSAEGRSDSAGPTNSASTTAGVQHGNVSGGWRWPHYSVRLSTPKTGSIRLRLTIDKTGAVTKAEIIGGKAPAASDPALQSSCIQIAKSKKFTRSDGSEPPATATATLTFTFK